jgi:hypothetical protein
VALSDEEKQVILQMLDELDEQVRRVVISSLDALAEWLMGAASALYRKAKDMLYQLWQLLSSSF